MSTAQGHHRTKEKEREGGREGGREIEREREREGERREREGGEREKGASFLCYKVCASIACFFCSHIFCLSFGLDLTRYCIVGVKTTTTTKTENKQTNKQKTDNCSSVTPKHANIVGPCADNVGTCDTCTV